MAALIDEFLHLIDTTPDPSEDPIPFCRSLVMKRNYHRLVAFVDANSSPLSLPLQIQHWYLISLIKTKKHKEAQCFLASLPPPVQSDARMLYIRGICSLKALDFQSAATDFIASFSQDPVFIEPLHKLLSHHLISETDYIDLLNTPGLLSDAQLTALTSYGALSWLYKLDDSVAFKQVCELLKKNPSTKRTIIAYVSYCLVLKKRTELFALAQRLSESDLQSPVSMFAVGAHMSLIGRSEAARSLFCAALRTSPYFLAAWIGYAITHWHDGDSRTALNVIQIAIRAFPKMDLLHIWAGFLCSECGELSLCLAHYRRCQVSGYVLNEIGCVFLREKRIVEAIQVFSQAIRQPPPCPAYEINYATALRRHGDFEAAVQVLVAVEELNPENVPALIGLAFTYHLMARYDAAVLKYSKALGFAPENTFVQAMLDDAIQRSAANPIVDYIGRTEGDDRFDRDFAEWQARNLREA
jgi:tetratricopeptide (TPR) repeat protein